VKRRAGVLLAGGLLLIAAIGWERFTRAPAAPVTQRPRWPVDAPVPPPVPAATQAAPVADAGARPAAPDRP
jgi:hypothetical protein